MFVFYWCHRIICSYSSFDRRISCDSHGPLTRYINYGLCMRWECWERLPCHSGLAIPKRIRARAWRTCRDACRDRYLAVSLEVGGGENVPGIPGACATQDFAYLVRGPWLTPCWILLHRNKYNGENFEAELNFLWRFGIFWVLTKLMSLLERVLFTDISSVEKY